MQPRLRFAAATLSGWGGSAKWWVVPGQWRPGPCCSRPYVAAKDHADRSNGWLRQLVRKFQPPTVKSRWLSGGWFLSAGNGKLRSPWRHLAKGATVRRTWTPRRLGEFRDQAAKDLLPHDLSASPVRLLWFGLMNLAVAALQPGSNLQAMGC